MYPRIFISSTYYDLKYIRSDLEKFVRNYGFEPVLFESGTVYFKHNEKLDVSCYREVELCQMMILIVGGRYGSISSNIEIDQVGKEREEKKVSITRQEYRTADKSNIPTYVFIDKNVYAEYQTYYENRESFKSNELNNFKFAHVDDIDVFRFIEELHSKAIYPFEKFEDISNRLVSQWAAMFYTHLESLKKGELSFKVLDSIDDLKNTTSTINTMIDEIGKVLLTAEGKYDSITLEQDKKTIQLYTKKMMDTLVFEPISFEQDEQFVIEVREAIIDKIINAKPFIEDGGDRVDSFIIDLSYDDIEFKKLNTTFETNLKGLFIDTFDASTFAEIYNEKIFPIISKKEYGVDYFKQILDEEISKRYIWLF